MDGDDLREVLSAWFGEQVGSDRVRVDGLAAVDVGHSAEMLSLSLVTDRAGGEDREDVVVKVQPSSPGLLEPYDLGRQFRILRALEPTAVRAPRGRWLEPTGTVLGRPFYVMERLPGAVYEREVPEELDRPGRIPRMCEDLVDQLAEIHLVDLDATGLADLGDGADYVDRQLLHWAGEVERVGQGPLPALERLLVELHRQRPPRSSQASPPSPASRVTLVHGDAKPGNFAFGADGSVTGVLDWEMAELGDPLADIGYLELMWGYPVGITSRPTAPSIDEMVARYERRTGIVVEHRPWYRAFQAYKTAAILLVGSMLFDAGHSDDLRYFEMGLGVDMTTRAGLRDLGVDERLDAGPVLPRPERIAQAKARASGGNAR